MERRVLYEKNAANGIVVRVVQGDLTQEPVDAIVNAANSQLAHGGGVAGAIVRAGGRQIQQESDEWVAHHGPVPTGAAAITGAGRLACRFVIHAVGPVWHGRGDEDRLLASAVTSALQVAAEHDLQRVSLPAISTGIFGFPKPRGARVILQAVVDYPGPSSLREVNLTNTDAETAEICAQAADTLLEGEPT